MYLLLANNICNNFITLSTAEANHFSNKFHTCTLITITKTKSKTLNNTQL